MTKNEYSGGGKGKDDVQFSPFGIKPAEDMTASQSGLATLTPPATTSTTTNPDGSTTTTAPTSAPKTLDNPNGDPSKSAISATPNYDISNSKQDRVNSLFNPPQPSATQTVLSSAVPTVEAPSEIDANDYGLGTLKNNKLEQRGGGALAF